MRYIFWGSPEFAAIILSQLAECGLIPEAIVCNPDRPQGRHQAITPPEVKSWRDAHLTGTALFQPENVRDISPELLKLEPDIFVVAAYGKIIPESILKIAKYGAVGVHPSLLPKYRGASPIQSALLNGEDETGISLYRLTARMDDGPVYASQKVKIKNEDDFAGLTRRLGEAGGKLLCALLKKFPESLDTPLPQEESAATFTKKFETQDAFVPPAELKNALQGDAAAAAKVFNMIRAFNPEPGAWTMNEGVLASLPAKRLKLLKASLDGGNLMLDEVQAEGGRPQVISH